MVWKKSKGNIIFWRDSNLTVRNPFLLPNKKAIQFLTFKGSFNFRVDRQVITEIIQLVSSCQFQIFDFVKKKSFIILLGTFTNYMDQFLPILDYLADSFEGIPDTWKSAYPGDTYIVLSTLFVSTPYVIATHIKYRN